MAEPVFEAIINSDEADSIDPVLDIHIRDGVLTIGNGYHHYEYEVSKVSTLLIRKMEPGRGN